MKVSLLLPQKTLSGGGSRVFSSGRRRRSQKRGSFSSILLPFHYTLLKMGRGEGGAWATPLHEAKEQEGQKGKLKVGLSAASHMRLLEEEERYKLGEEEKGVRVDEGGRAGEEKIHPCSWSKFKQCIFLWDLFLETEK